MVGNNVYTKAMYLLFTTFVNNLILLHKLKVKLDSIHSLIKFLIKYILINDE